MENSNEEESNIEDLLDLIKSELGTNSLLFNIAIDELRDKRLEDINSDLFFEILDGANPSIKDSEIFLSCFQSFSEILDVEEWVLEEEDFAERISQFFMQSFI